MVLIELTIFKVKNRKLLNPKLLKKCEIPVYFINLDRSNERRKNLELELNKYFTNHHRVKAIDGHLLQSDIFKNKTELFEYDLSDFKDDGNNPGEIGCLLSHIKAIKKIHEDKCEYALVIEDDASFKYINKWGTTLKEIIEKAPKDFDVLKLYSYKTFDNLRLLINNIKYRKLDYVPKNEWSTCALIWSKKGVQNAMQFVKDDTFKVTKNDTEFIVADYFLFRTNKSYDFTQPLIYSNDYSSLVGSSNHQQLRTNKTLRMLYSN